MPHPSPTHGQSAAELKRQIELERDGAPFLVLRLESGEQVLVSLAGRTGLTVGRGDGVDVALEGDDGVSRLHAELELVGGSWLVIDDGLSTNGTFIEGERVVSRRRVADRELILIGETGLLFRDPAASADEGPGPTVAAADTATVQTLTETQRSVLVALCRPFAAGESFATPATNREIAETLFLSIDAVKGHLRVLFDRFGLAELPQNEKRARLAEQALRSGAVRVSDLSSG